MGPRTHEIISQTTLLEPKAADPGTRGAPGGQWRGRQTWQQRNARYHEL